MRYLHRASWPFVAIACTALAFLTILGELHLRRGWRGDGALAAERHSTPSVSLLPPASYAVPFTEFGTGRLLHGSISADEPERPEGTIVLNLAGMPLQQAAKTVLGDMLGVNYVVDARVEGQVSVQTTRPVSKAMALELFQLALKPIGAVLVQDRALYRIVPNDQSAVGSIVVGRNRPNEEGGASVRVIPLRYVAASELAHLLEPIVPTGAIVQADDGRNLIAVKGSPSEIRGILDTVALFDVDVTRATSSAVVPVKSADPEKLVEDLKAIFASENGPLKNRIRFIANRRMGSILVITAEPTYVERAKDWIARLDAQAEGTETELHVYAVQNRPAKELADVLRVMFSDDTNGAESNANTSPRSQQSSLSSPGGGDAMHGNAAGTGAGIFGAVQSPTGPQMAQSGFATGGGFSLGQAPGGPNGGPLGAGGNPASLATDPRGSQAGSGGASAAIDQPRLKIVADDAKNTLMIMAGDRDYKRILRIIRRMDVVPSQVLIQAAIAEVTLNDTLQYGVQTQLSGGKSSATFSDLSSGGLDAAFPGFNYAIKLSSIASTLSALNQITHVNVLSTPSLTVLDNRTAMLQVGDQVPITTATATSTLTSGAPIVNSVEMRDTGVILSVTPRINESGRVQLELEQEVSAVQQTTSSSINSPTIQQRRVKTTVVVNDGEVLALGGMIQTKTERDSSQIPLLGNLPIVGAAFASRNHAVTRTELVILLTPRVIRNAAESREVTETYRRKVPVEPPNIPKDLGGFAATTRRLGAQP